LKIIGLQAERNMINLAFALTDPASTFNSPKNVLLNHDLSKEQKIEVLRRWDYDMREIEVAEEENMQGQDNAEMHEQILAALHILKAYIDLEHTPPTKQGG
jgi:hypothetical protein